LVVSRAGLGSLTELSVLKKPAIIIPIPDSHQEDNANYFAEQKAIVLLKDKKINPRNLLIKIRELILDNEQRALLSLNISKLASTEASKTISKVILDNIST